ncbi:MAG: hypothetical protein H6684_12800 [Deltaproteobacteria bacterium]|nr:hypothetical protein [Deltaproteobacteria bacterium]MCB9489603.1 hypothetical protein [Deltaproteobacteria bacterium]
MIEAKSLLNHSLEWQPSLREGWDWEVIFGDTLCLLRMNDYPDEPLYTVFASGDSHDFDDKPTSWEIPYDP